MGLRERLETKARRRAAIQVPVEDTDQAQKLLDVARMQHLAAMVSNRPNDDSTPADVAAAAKVVEQTAQEVERAEAALEAMYAEVVLWAMDPGDFEALVDAHTTSNGDIDRPAFLPPALAASAEDEDLRDEQWWAEQLARPSWTDGERALLFRTIHALNDPSVRSAAVPKG